MTSTTGSPPHAAPQPPPHPALRGGATVSGVSTDPYGYDVERVDPGAPARLGGNRAPRRRRRPWVRWALFALSFLMLAASAIALYFFVILPLGFGTSLVAFTAALVPVAMIFAAVWWLDRYTPQPRMSLIYAFAWGAIGSVLLTLFFGGLFDAWISPAEETQLIDSFLGAVVQAPVIEEAMKSAGLIGLLIWGRRYISGPLDGLVYAALIAGGFAFTENILYFSQSFHQAQAGGEVAVFWQTFFLRGILSPFAHVS
ncbi:MAG: PrsW family intramembrane metalloprotease, partial [Brachybacterium sp.]|nr:PrsW family intramembrane metalloprotease [Brachybacterium sp.]